MTKCSICSHETHECGACRQCNCGEAEIIRFSQAPYSRERDYGEYCESLYETVRLVVPHTPHGFYKTC